MDDDFNTPQALAALFELVNLSNKNIMNCDFICQASGVFKELFSILGLSMPVTTKFHYGGFKKCFRFFWAIFKDESGYTEGDIAKRDIERLISERQKARQAKNFSLSDKFRKDLEDKGIILEDTKDGKTTWRRKI